MKKFFDILLYVSCATMTFTLIMTLKRFSFWVKKIDPSKNKTKKTSERYKADSIVRLEAKIFVIVLAYFIVALCAFFFGRTPKELENPGCIFLIPVLILLIGTGIGGVLLGKYFIYIGKKHDIFQKTNEFSTAYVRTRSQFAMGLIISFYFFLSIFFMLVNLFFITGLL